MTTEYGLLEITARMMAAVEKMEESEWYSYFDSNEQSEW